MRKWMRLLTVLMLVVVVACVGYAGVVALADDGTQPVVGIDWTATVAYAVQAIGAALGAVLLWLTFKYLVPLLKIPLLNVVAKWAVDMAERALGSGNGEDKYTMAAEFVVKALKGIHITVDQGQIKAAIISAWTALNLGQIAAGIKDVVAKPPDATA